MGLFTTKEDKQGHSEAKASEVKVASSPTNSLSLPLNLLEPRVSEKAGLGVKLNKYVFMVKPKSNKVEIKKAVEMKYQVKVVQVNVINMQGKAKQLGRFPGRTKNFRKAIVTLKKGDSIKGLTDTV